MRSVSLIWVLNWENENSSSATCFGFGVFHLLWHPRLSPVSQTRLIPEETPQPSVRIVLFTPFDLTVPNGARHRLTQIAEATDKFIFAWMNRWGYPPAVKTLFRRDSDGLVEVLNVRGDMPVSSGRYAKPNYAQDVIQRAIRQHHVAGVGHVWWIFIYLGDRPVRYNPWRGTGDPRDGGWAMVNYDTIQGEIRSDIGVEQGFNRDYFLKGTIHELGHAFGLPHVGPAPAFGFGNSLMGPNWWVYAERGYPDADQVYLTESSAAMLWKHPVFSGTTKGLFDRTSVKPVDFTPVFLSNQAEDSVTISGKVAADPPAHSVILIDDQGRPNAQYFAKS